MALSITNNTYAGSDVAEYFGQMFLSMRELSGNHISLLPNVKQKTNLPILGADGDVLRADDCSFTDDGSALSYRVVETEAYTHQMQICYNDVESIWEADRLRAGAHNSGDNDFNRWLIEFKLKEITSKLSREMWNGATPTNVQNGIMAIAQADANTVKVGSPVAITAANVIAEMTRLYQAAPIAVAQSSDARFYVSYEVYRHYVVALATTSGNANFNLNQTPGVAENLGIFGVPVIPVNLGGSDMIFTHTKNIFMATDLLSDLNQINIVDMSKTTAEAKVRFMARFRAGWNYAVSSDVAIYNAA